MSKKLQDKLDALADNFNVPSITDWKQGRFIDSQKYSRMGGEWKDEQIAREKTLIRPFGGTHNALFQVTNSEINDNANITAYLEALGDLLSEES